MTMPDPSAVERAAERLRELNTRAQCAWEALLSCPVDQVERWQATWLRLTKEYEKEYAAARTAGEAQRAGRDSS